MKTIKHKDLFAPIRGCMKCPLGYHRTLQVIGRGNIPARLLFIGEGPGSSEDMLGEAFVGPSGHLLNRMISDACSYINISIPPSYYITNVVMCRPWIWNDLDPEYNMNRQPHKQEALTCMQNVLFIYRLVKPEFVIFVGNVAEDYYKKEFTDAIRITHPAAHLRYGGVSSPTFQLDVRNLSELFKRMKK